ncbi:MAG: TrkH family potassium uptake protein [Acidimicrobiia bacterium]
MGAVAAPDQTAARRRGALHKPARLVTASFAAAIAVGTLVLMLPLSTAADGGAGLHTALFTATSAVTVTGLVVADTAAHWSAFGEAVILVLIQLGGIGIMTLASLVLLGLSRRLGLRHRLVAQLETGILTLGEVRSVVRQVAVVSLVAELAAAAVLLARFATGYDEPLGRAAWWAAFHAVSAFNNAGFALFPDSLERFATDPVVNLTVVAAIVVGGLGIPVIAELATDRVSWRKWSLHTRLTVVTTGALIGAAWALVCLFEWTNPASLGGLATGDKLLVGLFQGVTPRTAGFNTVDIAGLRETTWAVLSALMFIGAAPASTGGGIKVTTFALLGFVIRSEVRGDRDVSVFGRRVGEAAQRQALAIALIGVGVVAVSTLVLLSQGDWGLSAVLFEVTSAFGTAGLSTGITAAVPATGQLLLVLLMFAGRVGPLTVGAALAVRARDARFRYPEERPLVG